MATLALDSGGRSLQSAPATENRDAPYDQRHGALDVAFSAVADAGGRLSGALDSVLNFPKTAGDFVGSMHIPGVSWAAATVGSIFAGSLNVIVHGSTFGAAKWLQALRTWNGVERGVEDAFQGSEGVASITAQSFISSVPDEQMREDLKAYFSAHTKLAELRPNAGISDEERKTTEGALAQTLTQIELKLGRRSELLGLQELMGAGAAATIAAHAKLESLADKMASKMIAEVETAYSDRLGVAGSAMQGDWVLLASRGEAGREALRAKIRDHLLSAYEAEQRGEPALKQLAAAKDALHESFLSKSALREAGFYGVLGALMHTGALPAVLRFTAEHGGDAAALIGGVIQKGWEMVAPQFIQDGLAQALLYAKLALGTVASYYGIKVASGVYGVSKYMSDTFSSHTRSEAPPHVDVKVDLAPGSSPSPAQLHLDAARAEFGALDTGATPHIDAASMLNTVHGTGNGLGGADTVRPDVGIARPHIDVKTQIEGVKADALQVRPEVHIK